MAVTVPVLVQNLWSRFVLSWQFNLVFVQLRNSPRFISLYPTAVWNVFKDWVLSFWLNKIALSKNSPNNYAIVDFITNNCTFLGIFPWIYSSQSFRFSIFFLYFLWDKRIAIKVELTLKLLTQLYQGRQ